MNDRWHIGARSLRVDLRGRYLNRSGEEKRDLVASLDGVFGVLQPLRELAATL